MAFCPSLPENDDDVYGVHSSKHERNAPHTPSRQSHSYDLSSTCKVSVKTDNDKKSIDIREYIHDKWGGQNPSKDGVCLSVEEYVRVKGLVTTVDAELEKTDGESVTWHPLSGEHILRVGNFVNGDVKACGVDLRAMKKSKNGEMKATGKGITLSLEKWNNFKDAISRLEENEELDV